MLMDSIWPNSSSKEATSCCCVLLSSWPTHSVVLQMLSVSLFSGGRPLCRRSRSFSLSLRSCERERGEWCRRSLERERDRLCRDRRVRELDRDLLRFGDLEPECLPCLPSLNDERSISTDKSCCCWVALWGGYTPGKPGSPAEPGRGCPGTACPMGGIRTGKLCPGGKP